MVWSREPHAFQVVLSGRESTRQCRRRIPGPGRSPREGNGKPLPYSCLGNHMDRGAQWATVHAVAESATTEATEHTTWGGLRELLFIYRELMGCHMKEKQPVSMWLWKAKLDQGGTLWGEILGFNTRHYQSQFLAASSRSPYSAYFLCTSHQITWFAKIFSHSFGCLFTVLMLSFEAQNAFNEVQFTHFFVAVVYGFGVIPKKLLPNPGSWRFTPVFSSQSFTVLALHSSFWSILLFLYMIWGMGSTLSICMLMSSCPSTVCWKHFSFLIGLF